MMSPSSGCEPPDAEEPRGAEGHDGSKTQEREVGQPPDVQASCADTFGNSDIFGGAWANR